MRSALYLSTLILGSFASAQTAQATLYGTGCGGDTDDPTGYELFTSLNANDLSGTPGFAFQMFWTGSGYVVIPGSTNGFVMPTGAPAVFRDDQTISFPLPATFPTTFGDISSVHVCSNGYVWLEPSTSADYTESVSELLSGDMRICPYWDDLNPASGGSIYAETDPNNPLLFHVTWDAVPEFPSNGSNTFQVSFECGSGIIEVNYGAMSSSDGLVGYSPGHGVGDPGGTDLNNMGSGGMILGSGRSNLALTTGTRPVLNGSAASVTLENIPSSASLGAFLLGGNRSSAPNGIPLDSVGMTGCNLYVDFVIAAPGFTPTVSTQTFRAPLSGNLVGVHLHLQGVVAAPANRFGVMTSNAVDWLIGTN